VIYDNAKSSVIIVKKKEHPVDPILAVEKEENKDKEDKEDSGEKENNSPDTKSRVIQM
jgi:hypothetical protein